MIYLSNTVNAIEFGVPSSKPVYKVYKEFITPEKNVCLDLIYHNTPCKYIVKEEGIEEFVKQLEQSCDGTLELVNTIPTPTSYEIQGSFSYGNLCLGDIISALDKIMLLPNIDVQRDGIPWVICPKFLVFDKSHCTLKIPLYKEIDDEVFWDYLYAIDIHGELVMDTLVYLDSVYSDKENGDGFTDFVNAINTFESSKSCAVYSLNQYLDLMKQYAHVDLVVKALVNIIRNRDTHKGYRSNYYKLFQGSRIQKKETQVCEKYVYTGVYSEITFSKFIQQCDLTLDELDKLAFAPSMRDRYLKSIEGIPELESIYIYLKHITNTEMPDYTIMADYDKYEGIRQSLAKHIWLYHHVIQRTLSQFEQYVQIVTSDRCIPSKFFDKYIFWTVDGHEDEGLELSFYKPRTKQPE